MKLEMTQWELATLLFAKGDAASFKLPTGQTAFLQSIERESGSGNTFNLSVVVRMNVGRDMPMMLFVRTK